MGKNTKIWVDTYFELKALCIQRSEKQNAKGLELDREIVQQLLDLAGYQLPSK